MLGSSPDPSKDPLWAAGRADFLESHGLVCGGGIGTCAVQRHVMLQSSYPTGPKSSTPAWPHHAPGYRDEVPLKSKFFMTHHPWGQHSPYVFRGT